MMTVIHHFSCIVLPFSWLAASHVAVMAQFGCMPDIPIIIDDGGSADSDLVEHLDRTMGLKPPLEHVSDGAPGRPSANDIFTSPIKILKQMDQVSEINGCLGIGSFSTVYCCVINDRQVAVKLVAGDTNTREVEVMRGQNHPNLVSLLDVIAGPPSALVLELCAGGNMLTFIHFHGTRPILERMSLQTRLVVAYDVGVGLGYLHAQGFIHRDVKSGNIFLSEVVAEGADTLCVAKLGDLGFARPLDVTMTRAIGSVRNMAPEVLTTDTYSISADIYSMALFCYELCSLCVPYYTASKRNDAMLAMAILQGSRPSLEELPAQDPLSVPMAELLKQCWAEDPDVRLSISDFVSKLTNDFGVSR